MDLSELAGVEFACLPGCGFCCTTSPSVRGADEARLRASPRTASLVVKRDDGTLGIALATRRDGKPGTHCACLAGDRACGAYEERPVPCRLFPLHVHLGRRVQVALVRGCPGLWPDRRAAVATAPPAAPIEAWARPLVESALLAPDAAREAEKAKENFREFDRRLRELAWPADAGALSRVFSRAAPDWLAPDALANVYSGLADGNLDPRHAGDLALSEPLASADEMIEEVALEAFPADGMKLPAFVDRSMTWRALRLDESAGFSRVAFRDDGTAKVEKGPESVADTLLDWSPAARAEAGAYLALLTRRDHLWGAAAILVDKTEYEVTFAAAYARVLADATALLLVHGGLAALARGADAVDAQDARDAVGATDMAFLSLPTLGAVL